MWVREWGQIGVGGERMGWRRREGGSGLIWGGKRIGG